MFRNYIYDYTNKDLFLPFGIMLLIISFMIMIISGVRIGQEWLSSTDFTKLNEMVVYAPEPEQPTVIQQTPQHSMMTGAYSTFQIQSPI